MLEGGPPVFNLIRVKLDERVLEVLGLGDEPVGVGVEPEKQVLGLDCQDAVARLRMGE